MQKIKKRQKLFFSLVGFFLFLLLLSHINFIKKARAVYPTDLSAPISSLYISCDGGATFTAHNTTSSVQCDGGTVVVYGVYQDNTAADSGVQTIALGNNYNGIPPVNPPTDLRSGADLIGGPPPPGDGSNPDPIYTSNHYLLGSSPTGAYYLTTSASDYAGNSSVPFTVTVTVLYSISGNVYIDNSVGAPTFVNAEVAGITLTGATNTSWDLAGSSTTANYPVGGVSTSFSYRYQAKVPTGTYTVKYIIAPTYPNYTFKYPINSSYTVVVGPGCTSVLTGPGASNKSICDDGHNMHDLNFAITNDNPWFQCNAFDCRNDGKVSQTFDNIPPLQFLSNTANHGIIFPGALSGTQTATNPGPAFGGNGGLLAPSNPWMVGGGTTIYTETFTAGSQIHTSYAILSQRIPSGPGSIGASCNSAPGCAITAALTPPGVGGVFVTNNPIFVTTTNFAGSNSTKPSSYIFFIKGDLDITGNITVENGATATFIVGGNITVEHNVTQLQGYYIADNSFTVKGNGLAACGTASADQALQIAGNVIAGAAQTGGTFNYTGINSRNLCGNSANTPSITLSNRPDFIVNTPEFLKILLNSWTELNP